MASSADKWNIPFFYATAADAGVSGSGSGFFWQQANNIFDDSKRGMVRIGKEYDDVDVISETTGEWEFPYDTADYYALEQTTGHHSGGESHGCQGCGYIANVTINETPPKFYFQKAMYFGGTKYQHSSGKFTNPKVTEKVVGNGFKGFCFVRYNKKDGRSTGHDSVILEIWWNEDPTTSDKLKNGWFMVKRIEDKGGWGKGGDTCNGVSDQVLTWSAVQWRYKSGTPEFSIHPIVPEYEDGDNIHCIDKEDLCFAASEKRGYCKNERIPRNTEMKCLFKFDAHNGIARLKNLSLREIDATKALDDTPDQPDPTEQPGETKTIQGKFKLQWDLNIQRVSECAGAGTGGYGGSSVFYDVQTADDIRVLANHIDFGYRTIHAETNASSSSDIHGKKLKQLDIPLYRVGSPSGNVVARIWNAAGTEVYTSPTTVSASGLSTSPTIVNYDFSTNTHAFVVGDRIGVQNTGTSNTAYVVTQIRTANVVAGANRSVYYTSPGTGWSELSSEDSELCAVMWE